jgi:hypothetical protein
MDKLSKTQLSTLASYSSPFVLIVALGLNAWLAVTGLSTSPLRLLVLSVAVPIGFSVGRLIYLKRSHVEILLDDNEFQILKGGKDVGQGRWRDFKEVSIILDQFARPNLRLYKSISGEYLDIPTSKTNAKPQELRDYVQELLTGKRLSPNLRFVEVS